MLLSEIVAAYLQDDTKPVGFMLEDKFVMRALRQALRFYCGYGKLLNAPFDTDKIHDPITADNDADGVGQDFHLTPSEAAVIRPLFDLYVERENAMVLEASRVMGADVFGRTVAEIQQDINLHEDAMPKQAFFEPAETI